MSLRIIISPAKKMNEDTDSLGWRDLPQFLPRTQVLLDQLKKMSYADLQALWKCNGSIADLNFERIQHMDLQTQLTPAILAYEGIQYQYMAPGVFSEGEFAYVQDHLRILSGFYGMLRPMDGVKPYRLEMQAKLSAENHRDLYAFWGSSLAQALFDESKCIINLASKEYSACIARHLKKDIRMISCIFGEEKDGKIIEKGTMCKMARGEMVRYMAENRIEEPEKLKHFDRLGYRFDEAGSNESSYVFIKQNQQPEFTDC